MASHQDSLSMALFCDFENVALGVRDAQYEKFDIRPVLERLLLKGSIVVKKAYCDWDRYKGFKAAMHEANFELIEIPHVRQSGKNSADIRLVVDALDLCYTKSHVDTFVIISGDSDFSPLVSKLRENAKQVIGVGIKQSTSDLLIANCDEFIFYDDLVRESQRSSSRREQRNAQPGGKRPADDEKQRKEELEARRSKAIDLAVSTFDALVSERGDSGKMWASVLKEAIKRRRPDFNESYYGFRAFGNLLEAAQQRGLLEVGRDEKSGTYVFRNHGGDDGVGSGERSEAQHAVPVDAAATKGAGEPARPAASEAAQPESGRRKEGGRQGTSSDGRRGRAKPTPQSASPAESPAPAAASAPVAPAAPAPAPTSASTPAPAPVSATTPATDAAAAGWPAAARGATSVEGPAAQRSDDAHAVSRDIEQDTQQAAPAPAPAASAPPTRAAAKPTGDKSSGDKATQDKPTQDKPDPRPAKAAKAAKTAKKAARKTAGPVDAAQTPASDAAADAPPTRARRARKTSAKSAAQVSAGSGAAARKDDAPSAD